MQITQQSFLKSVNQAWQYSQKEPVLIDGENDKRVLISYEFYQQLLAGVGIQKSNSERLGMSVADLDKSGDVAFDRVSDLPRDIEL